MLSTRLPVGISAWDVALGILGSGACVAAAIALACAEVLRSFQMHSIIVGLPLVQYDIVQSTYRALLYSQCTSVEVCIMVAAYCRTRCDITR